MPTSTKRSRAARTRRRSRCERSAHVVKRIPCLLAAWIVAAASAHAGDDAALKAGVFEPARVAPEFTLQGSDGNELRLTRYRGKVVLLGFGFTSCLAVCPVTLGTLAAAHKALGKEAGELQVVYITVDPDRDDAAQMHKYLA